MRQLSYGSLEVEVLTMYRPVIIYLLLVIIVLLLDVLAIILFLRDALKPGTFLTMNCFQTGFWGGALLVNLAAIGRGADAVGIGFSVVVL